MSRNPATNAVRQILMNELGLTRESVREEMRKILAGEVEKAVKALPLEEWVRRIVKKSVSTGWNDNGDTKIAEMVTAAVKKEVGRRTTEALGALTVSVSLNQPAEKSGG